MFVGPGGGFGRFPVGSKSSGKPTETKQHEEPRTRKPMNGERGNHQYTSPSRTDKLQITKTIARTSNDHHKDSDKMQESKEAAMRQHPDRQTDRPDSDGPDPDRND